MHYLLLLSFEPGSGAQPGTPEHDAEMKAWTELNDEMKKAGVLAAVSGLEGNESATTVRSRGGDVVLTDGPYAETKEVLFSFYVLDVPDLDAATGWARRMPAIAYGAVEVRPMVHPDLG